MDDINKRVLDLMDLYKYSKSVFANELGISLPLLTHISTGRNRPGLELIQKILRTFPEISPDWLINGNGEQKRKEISPPDFSTEASSLGTIAHELKSLATQLQQVQSYQQILLEEITHLQQVNLLTAGIRKKGDQLAAELSAIREQLRIKSGQKS